jgi:hypothetical protein
MARASRWTKEDRKKLWKLVREGVAEQDIREQYATTDAKGNNRPMTALEFAMQYKQASVEAGEIKQAARAKESEKMVGYQVTATGRLTITDFAEITGAQGGDSFGLMRPRGRSNAWRLVPIK